jgi:ppGpp synthetase/RelA/SpoT-type nucleotidyltranferase
MEDIFSDLKTQYDQAVTDCKKFCDELSYQIEELLESSGFNDLSFTIEDRVKSWESIFNNLRNQKYNLRNIIELNDLIGIRIIVLFKDDVEKICETLRSNFSVLEEENKQKTLLADQFGYLSIHFVISLSEKWTALPTLKKFSKFKAEVQVRTAAQHIWANASHLLNYKKPNQIPIDVLRALNRSAAMLEVIDNELSLVLGEKVKYLASIEAKQNTELNIESLKTVIEEILPPESKMDNEDLSDVLDELIHFEIKDTDSLRKIYEKHKGVILEKDKSNAEGVLNLEGTARNPSRIILERAKKGIFATHVGLLRTTLYNEFGQEVMNYVTKKMATRPPAEW